MSYAEKDFQTRFNKWVHYRYRKTACFELKITHDGHALPFNAVKPHQISALQASKHRILIYKISDESRGNKPFDCFSLCGVPAFVVVQYYQKGVKHFYMIDVDAFVTETETANRSSLTEERAREIGERFVLGE